MNCVWRMAGMLCICAAVLVAISRGFAGEAEGTQEPAIVQQPAVPTPVYGESLEPQRIIVTATRIPTPAEQVPMPLTVFSGGRPGEMQRPNVYTAGNIEARQYRSVLEVLRETPGVSYYTSGGSGTLSSLFMRGMQAGNTVVMLDGMPMNDPSSTGGAYDFGVGSLDNIGQLEVMRGPQSTLFGSSATGGVVNMTSMKGEGPFKGFVSTEAGSHGTARTRFGSSAGTDKVDYSFAGTLLHTDGISVSDARYGTTERDRHRLGSFGLRLGANITDMLRFDLFSNGVWSEKEFDAGPGFDDFDYKGRIQRVMVRPQLSLALFDGRWEQTVGFGYANTTRHDYDDDYSLGFGRTKFVGETTKFDYKSVLQLHETNTLVAGVDVVSESMEKEDPWYGALYPDYFGGGTSPLVHRDAEATSVGMYIEDQINICDVFFASAGLRHEQHDDFGGHTTWKTSAMYVLPTATRLKVSTGTGFKTPTLDQLYNDYPSPFWPIYSNPNLKPEESFGWDAGFEQSLFDERLVFGSTFFRNKIKNHITSDGAGQYQNSRRYRTWGFESFINFALTDSLMVSLQHTWLRWSDEWTDNNSGIGSRRPKHEFSVNADWTFLEKGTLTAGVRHTGKRMDTGATWNTAPFNNPNMPSHTIVRVGASWKINDHMEVYGRVENLLDKKYQEIAGYGTEGIAAFGGFTFSF